jgi:hypothetical protein
MIFTKWMKIWKDDRLSQFDSRIVNQILGNTCQNSVRYLGHLLEDDTWKERIPIEIGMGFEFEYEQDERLGTSPWIYQPYFGR